MMMRHFSNKSYINGSSPARGEARNKKGEETAVWLLLWTFAACLIPNIWLAIADRMSLLPALTNIVFPAGLYLLFLSAGRKIGIRVLCCIVLFVLASFQMVLLFMYGRSIIAVDMFLNVVTTNSAEIGELLGNLSSIIALIIVVYLPPLIVGVISIPQHWELPMRFKRKALNTSWVLTFAGLIMLGGCYLLKPDEYKVYCDLYPANVCYNLKEAVHRTFKTAKYQENVANVKYPAVSTHPDSVPETYVLVIGETSRAENWQLGGYGRQTNPELIGKEGLVYFPKTFSQSNTTHKSVPMLFSHLDATTFGDSIYHTKSLLNAFRNAGFHTSFYTAQSPNHSFIDFFGEEADDWVFIRENADPEAPFSDLDLLSYLDKELASGHKKKLIVLHTYGSHFNYIDRYPRDKARFLPDGPAEATKEYRKEQINAYDNTIALTSELLSEVIDRLNKRDGYASMLYTSDHGEDVFDDDRNLFLHASPVPSYYQIHVPFIVWNNSELRKDYKEKAEALDGNREKRVASSVALYHTLMDMAGIVTPQVKPESSLASNDYTPGEFLYLNDHNKGVPLTKCGLRKQDYQKLDSIGISF